MIVLGLAVASTWIAPGPSCSAEFVVAEGEQFQSLDNHGWQVTHQDDSWASHTSGGMWSTHGALLGAPADSVGSVAAQTVTIPRDEDYRVWSKHQAPPYFNYLHQVEIVQEGQVVFSHVYGAVNAERMWSFNQGPLKQLWWAWGLDHDAAEAPRRTVRLTAGAAEVCLITVPNVAPAGDVMVDFVALTTNTDDQAGNTRQLCVEALKSTRLYVRFRNTTDQPARLKFRRPRGHWQPSYGGGTFTIPDMPVAAGRWSAWYNIGPNLHLVHEDGQVVTLPGAEQIELEVARDAEGRDIAGDMIVPQGHTVVFPLDITWNRSRRVLTGRQYVDRLTRLARTKWRTANGGRKPKALLYYGRFPTELGMLLKDTLGYNTELPERYEQQPSPVVNFGDEIDIGAIKWDDPLMQERFVQWLKQNRIGTSDLRMAPDEAKLSDRHKNARVDWYAQKFSASQRYADFRRRTEDAGRIRGTRTLTGANYSPHGMPQYYGRYNQYIELFKHNVMSMYWTEDYLFSVPQPPQFISWMFAMMRCATKYNEQIIHMYVMPHAPGQLPQVLRRNMVYSVGAGARHIDNFCVCPSSHLTENYVSWTSTDTFRVLHESIYDSAEAEPYQVGGRLRPARVAVVYSAATDHNERKVVVRKQDDPFLSRSGNAPEAGAQRTTCRLDQQLLYLALKHAQHNVDLVTEDDVADGCLKDYDVAYFAGEWIDHRLPGVLEQWVRAGGVLYACAGLGHKNEFDEPYDGMATLLGLNGSSFAQNVHVIRPYLELPLVEPIGMIIMGQARIPGIAIRQELDPGQTKVLGRWENGAAAVTVRELGHGKAFAVGTAAGHSYLKTGLRMTPCARGGRKTVYNPTAFSPAAAKLARLGVADVEVERDVLCSNPNVEALVIDSTGGTLVTLTNWDNDPLVDLAVSVKLPAAPRFIRSVQQQRELKGWNFRDGRVHFTTDLEWADYILLPTMESSSSIDPRSPPP